MQVGSKYRVKLHYEVEHIIEVPAPTEDEAERLADEARFVTEPEPTDRMILHADVEELEPIYEGTEEAAPLGFGPEDTGAQADNHDNQ
jgi:hypothetical protein